MARPNASVRPQASVAGQAKRAHLFGAVITMSLREISRIRDRAPCSPARPTAMRRLFYTRIAFIVDPCKGLAHAREPPVVGPIGLKHIKPRAGSPSVPHQRCNSGW